MLPKGLSIIIPIYNTPIAYLEENFAQLSNHEYSFPIEVIVVNDGSTKDDVKNYLKKIAGKIPYLRIIDKENAGVATARNTGIEYAQYSWLTFLDADDELIIADNFSLDGLREDTLHFFDGETFHEKGTKQDLTIGSNDTIISQENLIKAQLALDEGNYQGVNGFFASVCWGKLFPTEKIQNKITFDEKLNKREDVVFMSEVYANVDRFSKIDGLFYRYRVENEASLSLKYQQNLSQTYMTVYKKLDQLVPYKKELAAYDFNLIHEVLTLDLFHPANRDNKKTKKEIIQKMISLGKTNPYYKEINFSGSIGRNKKILYQALQKEWFFIIFMLYRLKSRRT